MNGNAFGLEMKKLFEQRRRHEGNVYFGVALRSTESLHSKEGLHANESASEADSPTSAGMSSVDPVPISPKLPLYREEKCKIENYKEEGTGSTQNTPPVVTEPPSQADG